MIARPPDAWREPEGIHPVAWGTMIYVLVSVGRLPEVVPVLEPLKLGKVGIVIALVGLVFAPRERRTMAPMASSLGIALTMLVVLAFLSITFSIWRGYTISYFFDIIAKHLLMFYLIAKSIDNRRMVRVYLGTLVVCGAMLAFLVVRIGDGGGRVELNSAYDSNDLAMILVAMIAIAAAGVFAMRGLWRWGLVGAGAVLLLATMMTGSRGGFLGLVGVAAYLGVARFATVSGRLTPRLSPVKTGLIGLGALLLAVMVPDYTWERMRTLARPADDYNVTNQDTGRIAIWRRGIEGTLERPIGHGLANFEYFYARKTGIYKAAHNAYVQIGVELGLLGLLLFLSFFWLSARATRRILTAAADRARRRALDDGEITLAGAATGLRGALVGYFITSLFLSAAYTPLPYVLIAIVAGIDGVAPT